MKLFANYRFYILTILAAVATICGICEPSENLDIFTWVGTLLLTRFVAVLAVIAFIRLWQRWSKQDAIPELQKITEKE